jgi:hypothetical protein
MYVAVSPSLPIDRITIRVPPTARDQFFGSDPKALLTHWNRRAKLFRFDPGSSEWKERGTGDVRLLAHKETKKIRLVMRRDKTLKVCANHISQQFLRCCMPYTPANVGYHAVSSDMRLQPNIGSDRSWVWKVAADYAETPATAETLAIRFANADSTPYVHYAAWQE